MNSLILGSLVFNFINIKPIPSRNLSTNPKTLLVRADKAYQSAIGFITGKTSEQSFPLEISLYKHII